MAEGGNKEDVEEVEEEREVGGGGEGDWEGNPCNERGVRTDCRCERMVEEEEDVTEEEEEEDEEDELEVNVEE